MILADYLERLVDDGRPLFDSPDPARDSGKPAERTALLLEELDQKRRLQAPGDAPVFDLAPAHLALVCLCRLSQYTVFREIPKEQIEEEWEALSAQILRFPPDPERIWSVDVALSYLPGLFRIARNVAESDPMIEPIRELARRWPLSGIGIDNVKWSETDFAPLLAHPTLSGLLVDRIFEFRDRTAATFPSIRSLLDDAIGVYGKEFAPWLADIPVGTAT